MARAYDSRNMMVTHEISVDVPGTFNGPSPAKNTAASPYYQGALYNGAAWISHSYGSAVRPLVQLNAIGEAAEFSVNAAVAGEYEVTVPQYILTGTKPQFEARVNGALVGVNSAVQTVTNVNDFGREATVTFKAHLVAGANTIRIDSVSAGTVSMNGIRIAQP